ncbi:zinc finger, c3HC4 type (RING finger) domain-containing protein [Ditylenchus destructor]|uniref:Zinc finger, c3HC4 type (RING finger) domain-containing protein n=1 Tax=Ditylenchus destructor TaxID=166010 RepID=A0AAD4NFX9_9BILA|nr:zinc finger, c3HC4 type (RING finger) domain-containing protein [Ditylenchus destructor]
MPLSGLLAAVRKKILTYPSSSHHQHLDDSDSAESSDHHCRRKSADNCACQCHSCHCCDNTVEGSREFGRPLSENAPQQRRAGSAKPAQDSRCRSDNDLGFCQLGNCPSTSTSSVGMHHDNKDVNENIKEAADKALRRHLSTFVVNPNTGEAKGVSGVPTTSQNRRGTMDRENHRPTSGKYSCCGCTGGDRSRGSQRHSRSAKNSHRTGSEYGVDPPTNMDCLGFSASTRSRKKTQSAERASSKPNMPPTRTVRIQKLLERFRRDPEEPNAEDRCCICYVRRASVRAYPCGHQVFCRMCGVSIIQSLFESKEEMMRCVLCRNQIAVLRHQKTGKMTSIKDLNPSKMTEQPARLWPWHWN